MTESEKNKIEVELRGKVIALSLRVEDALTRIIYNFFYPKASDDESKRIFLEEFIFQLTFNKKKEILLHMVMILLEAFQLLIAMKLF